MIDKLCIIGVGLIGGSFAKAVKKTKQAGTIVGFGRRESNLKKAKELGVIDNYSLDIASALKGAEMILIATPVGEFEVVLKLLKPHIDKSVIICDVGSTKSSVVRIASEVFGEIPARFIPAHPIAGKEKSGVIAADGGLFEDKKVILTPQKNADTKALKVVHNLWQTIGAKVEIMNEKTHDDLLAMTSHLPHILAFGLMDYLRNSNSNVFDYAAGGFKDFSRIASSNSLMWRDICINNQDEIVKHIEQYQKTLDKFSNLIKNAESQALETLFKEAKYTRDNWLKKLKN